MRKHEHGPDTLERGTRHQVHALLRFLGDVLFSVQDLQVSQVQNSTEFHRIALLQLVRNLLQPNRLIAEEKAKQL